MYGATKLSTQQATNMEWSIANCKMCHAMPRVLMWAIKAL